MSVMRRRSLPALPLLLTIAAMLSPVVRLSAEDWNEFRGPGRRGVSNETGHLRSWDEGGPRELWRRPLGEGFSAIVVEGNRLYTLYAQGGTEFAASFRVEDGSELWRREIGRSFQEMWGNGPRATPTIAEGTLYVLSSYGYLAALRAEDGEPQWEVHLEERFGKRKRSPYPNEKAKGATRGRDVGYCSSPLLEGDLLITSTGAGNGKSLAALDRRTGATRWTALDSDLAESSPIAVTISGQRQILLAAPTEIVSLQPSSGELLWRYPWSLDVIGLPVFVPPNRVFVSSPNEVGAVMLAVNTESNGVDVLWREPRMQNSWQSSLALNDTIIGYDNATLKALSADGQLVWAKRGLGRGTIIATADGLLFALSERGTLTLGESIEQGFVEVGQAKVMEDLSWTSPTLANGRLYVRNHQELVSLDVRDTGAETQEAALTQPVDLAASQEFTGEQAIGKCVEALGGEEAWSAIESLEMTCQYTSFGVTLPCRLRRKRDNLYRFDYSHFKIPRTDVFDGKAAWWQYGLVGITKSTWPVEALDPYSPFIRRAAEFEMPFIRYREKGHKIKFNGITEIGQESFLEFQATRLDGDTERWLLSSQTFLPVLRIAPGVFHGRRVEERVYFSEYRKVAGGIVLPVLVETESGNDFQVLEINEVQTNVDIDDKIFTMPLPEGMVHLESLAGSWKVRILSRDNPDVHIESEKTWEEDYTTAVIHSLFGGSLLEEDIEVTTERHRRIRRQYTWDRFRRIYRTAYFDSFSRYLDVLEGDLDKDGRLVTTNVSTDTPVEIINRKEYVRETLYDITTDSFHLDRDISLDGGETWIPDIRFVYTRNHDESTNP